MRTLSTSGILLAVILGASGCYVDDDFCCDDTEIIRFENHTDLLIDNFIDGRYVGTVPRFGRLEVEGDYEGLRTFRSEATEVDLTWGPTDFRIFDGDLFVLDLEDDGRFKISAQSTKPKP